MKEGKSVDNPPVEVQLFSSDEEQPETVTHRQRVRRRIILIALKLFSKRGYKHVTVSDIANIVGMSERTFFRYFDSKEDLLFFWVDWQQQVILELLDQEDDQQKPLQALRHCFIHLGELNEKREDKARSLVKLIMDTPELRSRYYADHLKWEDRLVAALTPSSASTQPLSELQNFQLRIQVNVAISLYVSVIRPWAFETLGSRSLPKLVAEAYDSLDSEVFDRQN